MISRYEAHALLQSIAFLLLFPLGALVALFRNKIGYGWKTTHITLQLTASAMVFLAVYLMATRPNKKESVEKQNHRLLGKTIVGLIVFQLVWAFVGRRVVDYGTWLWIHMVLSVGIIAGGWTNLWLGAKS